MAGGSDKNWVLEGPTVWQKNFNFAFSELYVSTSYLNPTTKVLLHFKYKI